MMFSKRVNISSRSCINWHTFYFVLCGWWGGTDSFRLKSNFVVEQRSRRRRRRWHLNLNLNRFSQIQKTGSSIMIKVKMENRLNMTLMCVCVCVCSQSERVNFLLDHVFRIEYASLTVSNRCIPNRCYFFSFKLLLFLFICNLSKNRKHKGDRLRRDNKYKINVIIISIWSCLDLIRWIYIFLFLSLSLFQFTYAI